MRVGEATLIERAAFAVATVAAQVLGRVYGARIAVLAGGGHNAADACLAGQSLARRGASVTVVRASDRDGDEHWHRALAGLPVIRVGGDLAALDGVDLIIDGLTGVGGAGGLR